MLISQRLFSVMIWTKIKFEKSQRAITEKLCRVDLSFLCTAFLLNLIYPPMKFQVDISTYEVSS
jgi:hypothetical protein